MNGRIKYRIWDKKSKSFIRDKNTNIDLKGNVSWNFYYEYFKETRKPSQVIVQVCTDLKDKRGKLIYEGDIVEYDCGHELDNQFYKNLLTSEVSYVNGKWRIRYSADSYIWRNMEVIGNVLENPELIKK